MAATLSDIDARLANAGIRMGRTPEESGEAGSPSSEAQRLLRALRNVIIPLIHPANEACKHDANQNTLELGLDGKAFVSALEEFMSSFLRQRGPVDGIEVDLELEEGEDIPDAGTQATSDNDLSSKDVADVASDLKPPPKENGGQDELVSIEASNEESPNRSMVSMDTDLFELDKWLFIEDSLNALRKHVFDTMPIRLLCFKPSGSKLQITLVERGEIYARIASSLKNIDFAEVSRRITSEKVYILENCPDQYNTVDVKQSVMDDLIREYTRYAILSHTWLRGKSREVTYGDWIRREFDPQQPGYEKLVNFCKTASKDHGVVFGWMDTICINKESSAELDESIRSMYKWYSSASICITYLADTMTLVNMPKDTWFTRGWTLQELFAPSYIKFYNSNWEKLVESLQSDKDNSIITKKIKEATTITARELNQKLLWIPISRRMQMAAKRQVTREEDSAYSLMGIFDISIATAYGEGAERAFSRLLQAVLNSTSSGIADIFNWAGCDISHCSSLLPSSLQGYLNRSSSPSGWRDPVEPIMPTHLGLRITILCMPAIPIENPPEAQYDPIGDFHAIADMSIDESFSKAALLSRATYSILDSRTYNNNSWNEETGLTLGVLNIADLGTDVVVPKYCLAVALVCGSRIKAPTEKPVSFILNKRGNLYKDFDHHVKRSELESHGMKLVEVVL